MCPRVLACMYHALKAKIFKWAFIKAFCEPSPELWWVSLYLGVLLLCPALMLVLFPHLVEDKVKDQLEAAKPEPIIDEVVGILRAALCRVHLSVSRLEPCLQLSLGVSSSSLGSGKPGPQEARLVSVCRALLLGKGYLHHWWVTVTSRLSGLG